MSGISELVDFYKQTEICAQGNNNKTVARPNTHK